LLGVSWADALWAVGDLVQCRKAHLKAITLDHLCSGCWMNIARCIVEEKGFSPNPQKQGENNRFTSINPSGPTKRARVDFWLDWGYLWECYGDIDKAEEYYFPRTEGKTQQCYGAE